MAKRDRGIITRRRILEAAAEVFEKEGYQAATVTEIVEVANVTKGALYFHFPSKEDLVQGIFDAQDLDVLVRPQPVKLQELVDGTYIFARRLATESLIRASVRISLDSRTRQGLADRSPFKEWTACVLRSLRAAEAQGELLPHVKPAETADLCVSAFAGLQLTTRAPHEDEDLPRRLSVLLHHLLPSIAVPAILAALDLSPDRLDALDGAPEKDSCVLGEDGSCGLPDDASAVLDDAESTALEGAETPPSTLLV
ncbi:ScbR family autoregulator-binding transcription factor [Streptomyces daliensis]|uniref:TetR/AcrR family transcriptional regulator n=1 Tax=Streptomyces daliensis TaxID=299421 RepID=A0A8T4IJG5_9ACTN|nr:TetR/AcrR family transcriptional regulator [Streptomyces daliensis]